MHAIKKQKKSEESTRTSSMVDHISLTQTENKLKTVYDQAINELDNIVGNSDVKRDIINYVNVITNERKYNIKSKSMYHMMILGPPGSGKTTLSKIIAKIFWSVRILKKPEQPINPIKSTIDILQQTLEEYTKILPLKNKHIKQLEHRINTLVYAVEKLQYEMYCMDSAVEKCLWNTHLVTQNNRSYKDKIDSLNYYLQIFNTVYHSRAPELQSLIHFCNQIHKDSDFVEPRGNKSSKPVNIDKDKNSEKSADSVDIDDICVIADRADLIAEYHGQTAIKTKEFLEKHVGKVIFIDEAYQMFQCEKDSFGTEALTVINTYMTEHPDKYIFIFSGYKHEMINSLFKSQKGLERRITKVFTLEKPDYKGLFSIFKSQAAEHGYAVSDDCLECFKNNYDKFKFSGGSTLQLLSFVKSEYWKRTLEFPTLCFTRIDINRAIDHMSSVIDNNNKNCQHIYM